MTKARAFVTMICFPRLATIAALKRELGWKISLAIALIDIGLALLLGRIAHRLLYSD